MTRKHLSTRTRAEVFARHDGICHLCQGKIDGTKEAWDVSHETPLELGGADDESNWLVAHRKCHRAHTAKVDVPAIAKAKRREANHVGATAPARTKIKSRGFPKSPRQSPTRTPDKLAHLPRKTFT